MSGKLTVAIAVIVLLFPRFSYAQNNRDENRQKSSPSFDMSLLPKDTGSHIPKYVFHIAFEPGVLFGDMYNATSNNFIMAGFRVGAYRFISRKAAVGLGSIAWVTTVGGDFTETASISIGPNFMLTNRETGNENTLFLDLFTHLIVIGDPGGNSGVELGARIGGMRLHHGFSYAAGMAYDAMHDSPDGFRIFADFGLNLVSASRQTTGLQEISEKSWLFLLQLEPGLTRGEFYDRASEDGIQYGCRATLYTFLSFRTALGLGGRFSTMDIGRDFFKSRGLDLGPDLLIMVKDFSGERHIYSALSVRYLAQGILKHGVFSSPDSIYKTETGIEAGARFGIIRLPGGLTYGVGVVSDFMSDASDGHRFFADIGYGF